MDINGKRIVLTGAAGGIGRALLGRLAQYDTEVIAADIDAELLGKAVREPTNVRASLNPFVCDLSTVAGTDELFAHALATMGGIDLFFANAGFAYYERLSAADWQHIERIFKVNTVSPLYSAVKMNEINPDNPYITVITSSTQAHWGLPGYAVYGATKAAIHRFADAYRAELPAHGRLMMVYPIGTDTGFFNAAGAPPAYPLQPVEQVADAVISGIEQDATDVYPSWLWRVVSALNRLLPIFKRLTQQQYLRSFQQWEKQNGPSS